MRQVLVDQSAAFEKTATVRALATPVLGNSVFLSEGTSVVISPYTLHSPRVAQREFMAALVAFFLFNETHFHAGLLQVTSRCATRGKITLTLLSLSHKSPLPLKSSALTLFIMYAQACYLEMAPWEITWATF